LVPGKKICTPAVEELDRVLQMVVDLASLDHKKGRVRLLLLREVHLCRERGQRRSRSTAYRPPSLQIENEVSPPPPLLRAKGWLLLLWESEVVLGERNGTLGRGWCGLGRYISERSVG
jgi:hypothetical protein